MKVDLTVVIPCYDEMANLQKGVLEKVKLFLDKKKLSYEIIIVDDGSKDGSVEYITRFTRSNPQFKLIQNPHLGKGGAVTTGVLKAIGEYVLFTDMDQATPIEEIDKLLPFLEKKYDVVIGSRNTIRKGSPILRLIISRFAITLRKIIVGIPDISDTQCGFKAFQKPAARKLFTKVNSIHNGFKQISGSAVTYGFDIELLYLAQKMGYRVKEVPVTWRYVETRRVSPIKDSIEGVKDLIRIKMNEWQGKYDSTKS